MTGLVEWLRAAIAEHERVARAATGGPWRVDGMSVRGLSGLNQSDVMVIRHTWPQEAEHIVRNDPGFVLGTVQTHREILGFHSHNVSDYKGRRSPDAPLEQVHVEYCDCQCEDGVIQDIWPCRTLRLLAGIYRESFPGFDPSWIGES